MLKRAKKLPIFNHKISPGVGTFGKISCPGVGTFGKKSCLTPGEFDLARGRGWLPKRIEGSIMPCSILWPTYPTGGFGNFSRREGAGTIFNQTIFFWKICALGWRILSRAEIWLEPNPHHCLGVSETKYWWTVNRSISSYWQNASRNIVWSVLEEYYAAYEFLEGPPLRAFVNIPCKHILSSGCLERAFR